ncbi:hypothetical protein [Companilactobacillus jidongensis]|uniref:hypothetical protein n=1 Tax=Companilactobacillus jidongensis TaxID=2486006 RepID=UPI000F7BA86E|nr:hypothetical protein [Companilactobacillus jidongensis]
MKINNKITIIGISLFSTMALLNSQAISVKSDNNNDNNSTLVTSKDDSSITKVPLILKSDVGSDNKVYAPEDTPTELTGEFNISSDITEDDLPNSLKEIPGYTLNYISDSKIDLDEDGNVKPIVINYTANKDTPYTITYIDKNTGETIGTHHAKTGLMGTQFNYSLDVLTDDEIAPNFNVSEYHTDSIEPKNTLTQYDQSFTAYVIDTEPITATFIQTNSSGELLYPTTTIVNYPTNIMGDTIVIDSNTLSIPDDLSIDWEKSLYTGTHDGQGGSLGFEFLLNNVQSTEDLDESCNFIDLFNTLAFSIDSGSYEPMDMTFNIVYKTTKNTISYQTSDGTEVGTGSAEDGLGHTISNDIISSQLPKEYRLVDDSTEYTITDSTDPIIVLVQKDQNSGGSGNGSGSGSGSNNGGDTDTGSEDSIENIDNTISTYPGSAPITLYDNDGNELDQAVAPGSDWYTDQKKTVGDNIFYRVSTNTWVNASDAYIYYANKATVRTYSDSNKSLTTADNKTVNRGIKSGTDWYSNRYAYFNNEKHYQVATNEWVHSDDIYEYQSASSKITTNKATETYDDLGNNINTIANASSYYTDRVATINGVQMYRIATNEWVPVSDVN